MMVEQKTAAQRAADLKAQLAEAQAQADAEAAAERAKARENASPATVGDRVIYYAKADDEVGLEVGHPLAADILYVLNTDNNPPPDHVRLLVHGLSHSWRTAYCDRGTEPGQWE